MLKPFDGFKRDYCQNQARLLKQSESVYNELLKQRTQLMMKRETYNNNMFDLETLKQMVINEPQLQYLDSHHRKIREQQLRTNQAEKEYELSIETVNRLVDEVRSEYKQNLNQVQHNDIGFINTLKNTFDALKDSV